MKQKTIHQWGLFLCCVGLFGVSHVFANESNTNTINKKNYYPKISNPPGFYEGVILVSLMGGQTLAPGGSYIQEEKVYDKTVQTEIQLGNFGPATLYQPGLYFQSEFNADEIYQMDIEYGAWEHFGLGLTLFQFYISGRRQDLYIFPDQTRVYDPLPKTTNLYQGSGATISATYHPFSRKFIDPFVALRVGMVGFTGEAHQGMYKDNTRYNNKIRNGLGSVFGVGLGTNIFIGRTYGIRLETDYYKQYLKSDLFSTRTLNTYHAQIGLFINMVRFSAE